MVAVIVIIIGASIYFFGKAQNEEVKTISQEQITEELKQWCGKLRGNPHNDLDVKLSWLYSDTYWICLANDVELFDTEQVSDIVEWDKIVKITIIQE